MCGTENFFSANRILMTSQLCARVAVQSSFFIGRLPVSREYRTVCAAGCVWHGFWSTILHPQTNGGHREQCAAFLGWRRCGLCPWEGTLQERLGEASTTGAFHFNHQQWRLRYRLGLWHSMGSGPFALRSVVAHYALQAEIQFQKYPHVLNARQPHPVPKFVLP